MVTIVTIEGKIKKSYNIDYNWSYEARMICKTLNDIYEAKPATHEETRKNENKWWREGFTGSEIIFIKGDIDFLAQASS